MNKIPIRRSLRTIVLEVFLLLLSAFVLAMAFPSSLFKDGLGFLALFALIPVFAVIRNTSWRLVWLYGFIFGFVFYWIFNSWLSAFHPMANVIVQLIKAFEMVFLFLALKAGATFFPRKLSYVMQALFWVCYAYLSQSWFAGYPYGTVAYAFFKYKVLIQIASFSGIWLLTFLIVLPQSLLGDWLCCVFSKTCSLSRQSLPSFLGKNLVLVCSYAVSVLFQVIFGLISLSSYSALSADSYLSVATVQHNANTWEGGVANYRRNFNTLKRLSLEAANKDVDLIVWSETAFVPSVRWYTEHPYYGEDTGVNFDYLRDVQVLVKDFVSFAENLNVPLLTGNPSSVLADGETEPYTADGTWNNKLDYNSVILYEDNAVKQIYLKQHLVPFTEHFPYKKQLPFLYNYLKDKDYHWWEKGSESVVFSLANGVRFSTPICFEDVFGYLCADFVKNGAELLINMTNDSWSGSEAAERQHMAMAVFRSVENRRTTVRGTNSGVTCMILPDGTVAGEMESFKTGYKIWSAPVYDRSAVGTTLYTRISDLPVKVICVMSFASLCLRVFYLVIKGKKKRIEK